jgi:prevent-host-death family protein
MGEIGVRALRLDLSRVLTRAQAGETIVVTRDGVPIARIGPVHSPLPPALERLIESGRATWEGSPQALPEPAPLVGDGPTVAEILLGQRGDALPG